MDEGIEAGPLAGDGGIGQSHDHYGALGLPARASREQIERAYRFCREIYGPGSLATYSLLEPHEVEATRGRIDLAYQVLADPALRRAYDEARGLAPCEAPGLVVGAA